MNLRKILFRLSWISRVALSWWIEQPLIELVIWEEVCYDEINALVKGSDG
nr:MAG TPA: hypothetical protein [Caudoviricetes sp.]